MAVVRAALSIEGVTDPLPPPVSIGGAVTFRLAFTDAGGTAIAATGVSLQISRPDGVELAVPSGSMAGSGTGVWLYDLTLDQGGQYRISGVCTGPSGAVTDEIPLTVVGSSTSPPLPTGPVLVDENSQPLALPEGALLTLTRVDRAPEATELPGMKLVGVQSDQTKHITWETLEAAAAAAGGTDGSTAGATAGALSGAEAGTTAGTAAGTTAGAAAAEPFALTATEKAAEATNRAAAALASETAAATSKAGALDSRTAADLARDQAQAANANARLRYATLAALQANLTPGANAVAEVDSDGANNGTYLKSGATGTGSWSRINTATVGGLDTRLRAVPASTQPEHDGWLVAFRSGSRIFGGVREQNRDFVIARQRLRNLTDGRVRWEREAGGPGAELSPDGLRTDGGLGFVDGPLMQQLTEDQSFAGITQAHRINGKPIHYYGPRIHYAAGVTTTRAADGTLTIADRFGNLVSVDPAGVTEFRGLKPFVFDLDDVPGDPLLAFRDPQGRIAGFSPDADGFLRRQGATVAPDAMPYNSARRFGITGNGSDESSALVAAHDAAVAAGLRSLDFENLTVNAPSATSLGDVIFTGQSKLVGAYRKRIVPPFAGARNITSDVEPSAHLPTYTDGMTVRVGLMGDSTSVAADAIHPSEGLWALLREKLTRDNPGVTFIFNNRGISSQGWITADGISTTKPFWYMPTDTPWLNFVEADQNDLLFFQFGMNDMGGPSLTNFTSVMAKIAAWAKVPRLVFCTNSVPTTQGAAFGTKAQQEGRDKPAGFQRTYARRNGHGLIDGHRQFVVARDGFDVLDQPLSVVANNLTGQALPYTFAEEVSEFSFKALMSPGSTVLNAAQVLAITLSNATGNSILLKNNGANLVAVQVQTSDARIIYPYTATTVATTGSPLRLEVSVANSGWVTLALNGGIVFDGYVERFGGNYQPRIGYLGADTAIPCTIERAAVGRPRLYMPTLTDAEMYGDATLVDGNDANHLTAVGTAHVHAPVVAATSLRLPR
tara:strand:- start:19043 stop:22069 length:3027 start_codon:yes stop_codon:yes gene_type:complete